jgi:hypothetical protein
MRVRRKTAAEDRLEVLKQIHEDVITERDRLRAARASFTSRLGPLPASAAIVIGLTGATAKKVDPTWIVVAGVLFLWLVMVSTRFSGLAPYRLMRGRLQRELDEWPGKPKVTSFGFGRDAYSLREWLKAKIELEERICGELRSEQRFSLLRLLKTFVSRRRSPEDLQEALDVERSAFIVVQVLFVAIIGVLIAGIATA